MAFSLSIYITLCVFGLAFQQYAFMQFVRENPPFKRIIKVAHAAVFSFILTWVTGLYYYTSFYRTLEESKVLVGDYSWIHQFFVEPRGVLLALAPICSFLFLRFVSELEGSHSEQKKNHALLIALCALGFGAVILGTEILIGGAAN